MPQLLAAVAPALFGAAGSAALVTAAGSLTIAGSIVSIGSSLLISAAARALTGSRAATAQEKGRELSLPTTRPSYRTVYGECRATGTPVAQVVRGEYLFACYLLNSRPSHLAEFDLYIDKRAVPLTGDAFDFDGSGAAATGWPFQGETVRYIHVWIGRGDQTQPPQLILDDAPWAPGADEELFLPTDAWRGRTVLWLKARHRNNKDDYNERWPAYPPGIEVFGKWSKIHDPRAVWQDPDDPDTWEWTDNHALCVLDALRTNPVRIYSNDQLHLSSFIEAADTSDETVALLSGGSEPRYRAAGTVTWGSGEIEDQLNPLVLSGAADLIRIGGKLGLAAGAWRAPAVTLNYLLGDGIEFPDMVPGSELVNELRVSYLSAARGGETADLLPWPIPGALAADGGVAAPQNLDLAHCPSPTQAMRVRKIAGLRQRRQRRLIGGELPPEAFDLVAGATATIALPSPYNALDGIYEIEGLHPALDPLGDGGVALRMPARLVMTSAAIYDWTPADDEEEVVDEAYDGTRDGVSDPGAITVTTGATVNLNTGGVIFPRIRFAFAPSASPGIDTYQWEYRPDGGDYGEGGYIDGEVRDGAGDVFGFLIGAVGTLYDLRVRADSPSGRSDWVEITGITPVVSITLDVPTGGSATGGAGEIAVEWTTPNDGDTRALEILGSDTNDPLTAASIEIIAAAPNNRLGLTEAGLGPSVTRYYWARTRGDFASASALTAAVSATTDP